MCTQLEATLIVGSSIWNLYVIQPTWVWKRRKFFWSQFGHVNFKSFKFSLLFSNKILAFFCGWMLLNATFISNFMQFNMKFILLFFNKNLYFKNFFFFLCTQLEATLILGSSIWNMYLIQPTWVWKRRKFHLVAIWTGQFKIFEIFSALL